MNGGLHYGNSSISLGTLVAVPAFIILAAACIVLGILVRRYGRREDDEFASWFGVGLYVVAACFLGGLIIGMYPWRSQYHIWQQQTGTVKRLSSRLFVGKSNAQRFVVEFVGGAQRSCDDTRCALLKPGDVLTLTCKREWQFAGTDGWSCNYVGRRHA